MAAVAMVEVVVVVVVEAWQKRTVSGCFGGGDGDDCALNDASQRITSSVRLCPPWCAIKSVLMANSRLDVNPLCCSFSVREKEKENK